MEKLRQKWDTEFSTYFWQIHMDYKHVFNTTPMLTGYSKVRDQSEAQDKDYLLRRKICMLFKNGYFERMKRVEFFFKTAEVMDKRKAEKILICFPKTYDIPEANHDIIFKKHGMWLKTFYELINSGQSIDDILPKVRREGVDKDQFLNVESHEFPSTGHLYAYAARLSAHGHPPGAVEHFIRQYKQRKGW